MGLLGSRRSSLTSNNNTNSDDSQEIIRRLTADLIASKEENERLQEEQRAAVGARTSAVTKVRGLEDILRLKEQLALDMERQLISSQSLSDSLSFSLTTLESKLAAIEHDQLEFPLSDMDLLHRHNVQKGIFDSLYEALTCPICYEFFGRDAAVSLMCGHSFCSPCFKIWESKALENFKASSVQGRYEGAECPECRSKDVRKGRVRIWALEEVVRLVERGTKDSKVLYVPPEMKDVSEMDIDPVVAVEVEEPIEEIPVSSILRPRTSTPYAGVGGTA